MAKTVNIECFNLRELEALHPAAYAKVRERWVNQCKESGDVPWGEEIMDSFRAAVKALGGTLKDYSIGPWSYCHARVEFPDMEDDDGKEIPYNLEWYKGILRGLGYPDDGDFLGDCKLTGYCFDDDILQTIYRRLAAGDTIGECIDFVANLAGEMMESECEAQEEEDCMHANWDHLWFDSKGRRVDVD